MLRGSLRFIIVAGPSSSGKTTTTHKVMERLETAGVHVIPMSLDNYFFDLELHPKDEFGDYDFETPEAMDLRLINEHLAMCPDCARWFNQQSRLEDLLAE